MRYPLFIQKSILTLTSSFGLLLALNRRLFIVLSLTDLSDNAIPCAGSLKTLQCGIQSFVFANTNFCQNVSLPLPPVTEVISRPLPHTTRVIVKVCFVQT